jgi:glyoxylase-like metal-dependent hydrolase (beta-lactamase superfamily II)
VSTSRMHPKLRALALALAAVLLGCSERPQDDPTEHSAADHATSDSATGEGAGDLQTYGLDLDHAVEIVPGIFQARGTGNAHVIATPEGRVIFDTGLPTQSDRLRELIDAATSGPIRYVIASHAHLDHTGGAGSFMEDGTQLVAHRDYLDVQEYLYALIPAMVRRNKFFYPEVIPDLPAQILGPAIKALYPTYDPDIVVDQRFDFELGGTRFEVLHTPGAEGSDSISLWLPERKILFTGDLFGPIFPMFPNLTTVRGERFRFAEPYIRSLEVVLELEPEIIVPSHFAPVEGWEANIRPGVLRMRDAVRYVHDAVVDGMNDDVDVYTLMREIRLPDELALSQAHGTVPWTVRGIYEGYSTWFHFDSTTQLYGVPVASVYAEVGRAAGAEALAERAAMRLDAGEAVEALHLVDKALAADEKSRAALEVRLAALELLRERSGGVNHHEVVWLDTRIAETRAELGI